MVHNKAGFYAKERDAQVAKLLTHVPLHEKQRIMDLGVVCCQFNMAALRLV
jgi:hypothetical protein